MFKFYIIVAFLITPFLLIHNLRKLKIMFLNTMSIKTQTKNRNPKLMEKLSFKDTYDLKIISTITNTLIKERSFEEVISGMK